jgi:hypothetical protein
VARRKLGCDRAEVRDILETLRALCPVQPLTVAVHDLGLRLVERYGLSIYDAMIAAMVSRRTWKWWPGRPPEETDVGTQTESAFLDPCSVAVFAEVDRASPPQSRVRS